VRLLLDENVEKALLLGLRRRHPGLDVVRVVDVGLGGRRKQLKNSSQIRTLSLFRSRFIRERKSSRRVAKEARGG